MADLDQIKQPVLKYLNEFDDHFKKAMKSNVPLLNIITGYILKRKGKQIRPLLVFLSASATGKINKSTFHAASLIELLHTATLVHDDVVDDSNMRRGFNSVKALWKNKIAVLVGDYLLSRGLLIALDNDEHALLKIVSNATREMSEGELLQIEKARKLNVSEEVYFEIIRKKTASLLSACCAGGASSSGADDDTIHKMAMFGEKIGIAFQLKDDLLDYSSENITGKPVAQDLKEKKLTLPVLYTINNSVSRKKSKLVKKIRKKRKNAFAINQIIHEVKHSGGIDYAQEMVKKFYDEAIEILKTLPESEARQSLELLARYIIERNK